MSDQDVKTLGDTMDELAPTAAEWKARALDAERRVASLDALVQTLTDELADHEGDQNSECAPAGCVD